MKKYLTNRAISNSFWALNLKKIHALSEEPIHVLEISEQDARLIVSDTIRSCTSFTVTLFGIAGSSMTPFGRATFFSDAIRQKATPSRADERLSSVVIRCTQARRACQIRELLSKRPTGFGLQQPSKLTDCQSSMRIDRWLEVC